MKRSVLFIIGLATSVCSFAQIDVVGHRGESRLAPENTVKGFELAYKIGANWTECDLHYTKSGEIIIVHGPAELKSYWGIDKPVGYVNPSERQRAKLVHKEWKNLPDLRIPVLLDVLKCVPKGRFIECEIKGYASGFAKAFDDARKESGLDVSQVAVISFSQKALADFHSKYPEYKIRYIAVAADKNGNVKSPEDLINNAKYAGAEQISLGNYMKLDKAYVDKLKAAGFRVNFWCVDNEAQLAKAVECGVDTITSNRADYLKKNLPTFKSVAGKVELR